MRIGIDLGGTKTEGILLADDGSAAQTIRTDTPANNYTDTVEELCQQIDSLQENSKTRYTV